MVKIIIGVTGTKAAGKDEFIKTLEEYGFVPFSLADIVREEARGRGLPPSTQNLQNVGNELRRLKGNGVLAETTVNKISRLKEASQVVINSIRNPAEVELFQRRFGNKFFLIGIDADEEIRRKRYLKREGVKDEEFEEANRRDLREKESYGQHVTECLGFARKIIYNNGSLEELREKINELLCFDIGIKREKES